MIYVSIPVHEQIPVIINQIKNLQKYLICQPVIHISKKSQFSIGNLLDAIKCNNLSKFVLINNVSVDTLWGSIISAHLENVKFIKNNGARPTDKVVLMASNDLIVKQGLSEHLERNDCIFNLRKCEHAKYWWPALVANKDELFLQAVASIGGSRIYASQIEGSMYPVEILFDIVRIIENNKLLNSSLFYDRAEFYFSSFAKAMGCKPTADPFIFAEFHRFDSLLWPWFRFCDKWLSGNLANKSKKIINQWYFDSRLYRITKNDVDAIRNGTIKLIEILDGSELWHPYTNVSNLFGVKRVPRDIADPLRKYITELE